MSKVTISFDVNVSDLTFNKGKNGLTYINLPPYLTGKVTGMKAKAHMMKRSVTIIREEADAETKPAVSAPQEDRIANLEASIGRLAEMMAAMAPKAKTKAK
jgi:hypothetical protein